MTRKVYTTFILSASITRGVTYAKLTQPLHSQRRVPLWSCVIRMDWGLTLG